MSQAENRGKGAPEPPAGRVSKGGRPTLEESNPALAKLYHLIHTESLKHDKRADTVEAMDENADIKQLAATCKRRVDEKLYKAAMDWMKSQSSSTTAENSDE